MALRHGLVLTLSGIGVGIAGARLLVRLISSQLYGVKETDATTFVMASIFFLFVAMIACYVPARRATQIDPVTALRRE